MQRTRRHTRQQPPPRHPRPRPRPHSRGSLVRCLRQDSPARPPPPRCTLRVNHAVLQRDEFTPQRLAARRGMTRGCGVHGWDTNRLVCHKKEERAHAKQGTYRHMPRPQRTTAPGTSPRTRAPCPGRAAGPADTAHSPQRPRYSPRSRRRSTLQVNTAKKPHFENYFSTVSNKSTCPWMSAHLGKPSRTAQTYC